MIRLVLILLVLWQSGFSSIGEIDVKIKNNEKKYQSVTHNRGNLDKNIESLANKINTEEEAYRDIIEVLENTSMKILLNKLKLEKAKEKILKLEKQSIELKSKKDRIEKDVIDFVIDKYAMSMGVEQANKETLEDIIDKEVYLLILANAKEEVFDLNIAYIKVNKATRENIDHIADLKKFILKQQDIKQQYIKMEEEQSDIISSLQHKHKSYQQHLKKVIDKQNQLSDLLSNLDILKKDEVKKEKNRIKRLKELKRKKDLAKKRELARKKRKKLAEQKLRAKKKRQKSSKNKNVKKGYITDKLYSKKRTKSLKFSSKRTLDKDIDIEVKKLGSSTRGIKISKYYGNKTISPLKSYRISKKFGKYYDKVYKMELFNESVSMKPKRRNSKVFSIFKGEVVYAKKNSGMLDNVVIVKHKGGLHTIYSHLDKISPTLRIGKWIPKGYVVGRVSNTLLFQATKNSKYIDPEKLFK